MNNLHCYCVVLQIINLNKQACRLPVNVMATDTADARAIAVERAKRNGHNVTSWYSVELR